MTKITTTPRTHPTGAVALHEHPDDRRYVTLRHCLIGDRMREPGELVTAADLRGRNIGSMIIHGAIQQHIEPLKPKSSAKPRRRAAK